MHDYVLDAFRANVTQAAGWIMWQTEVPPDNPPPAAGVREPRNPLPGSPAIPAFLEQSYTGG